LEEVLSGVVESNVEASAAERGRESMAVAASSVAARVAPSAAIGFRVLNDHAMPAPNTDCRPEASGAGSSLEVLVDVDVDVSMRSSENPAELGTYPLQYRFAIELPTLAL
jgi:hypothetical protein